MLWAGEASLRNAPSYQGAENTEHGMLARKAGVPKTGGFLVQARGERCVTAAGTHAMCCAAWCTRI